MSVLDICILVYQKELGMLQTENNELSKKLAKCTRAYQVHLQTICVLLTSSAIGSEGTTSYLQKRGKPVQGWDAEIATAVTTSVYWL